MYFEGVFMENKIIKCEILIDHRYGISIIIY